jgi:hypothetical protein
VNPICIQLCAAASGSLLLAAPVLAQVRSPEPEAESREDAIVVTEDRGWPGSREVNRQARDISGITSDIYDKPLARIEDQLCPGVIGLKREAAQLMIDRIRWNAGRFDLSLADDSRCSPNLIIAFVEDGKTQIAELHENQPWLFRSLSLAERAALLEESGPVRVWTTAQLRTRDGMPVRRRQNLTDPPVTSMWMAHSKIYLTIREDITQVVVLLDRDAMRGKTVIQLADYATMRGLARTRPIEGDAVALDTILTLFDTSAVPPDGLTDFDQAYLRSLYDWIPNLPAASKLHGVDRRLNEVFEEEAERSEQRFNARE